MAAGKGVWYNLAMVKSLSFRMRICARALAVGLSLGAAAAKAPAPRDLPETAEGMFVQRKILSDVDVTLVSKGTFRFGRDRFFEWNTREPMPSTFYATPTNYSLTVNGKTTARALEVNVSSVEQLFSIREMKGFVKEVRARPETGFPTRVDVSFTNGDRLEIELARTR